MTRFGTPERPCLVIVAMRGNRVLHASWDNDVDVKVRDIVKQLEDDGWSVVRERGSHRQFKHATKPGLVTVAGKPGDDVAPGTLNSILKQAGLKP